ncbi:CPBP family intramembrane glutamic endopeptidase [Brevibacillus laterosporus]|uniref:CPBP family intramembrane glutamic endopeptidase n=1 Tax=Brevibacillus laterosporus TaxID=1465 RepID=UPI00399C80CC
MLSRQAYFQVIALTTLGVMYSCLSAAGEEIGWRGFMIPELLKENSFLKTSLITALMVSLPLSTNIVCRL